VVKKGDIIRKNLYQHWLHSHEEDTESELVYRPATFDFPPSRGRVGFEFLPSGTCAIFGIAPTNGSQKSDCRWSFENAKNLKIIISFESGETNTLYIKNIEKDKLVILKK